MTLAEKIRLKKEAAAATQLPLPGINPPDAAVPAPVDQYVPEPVVGGAAKALIESVERKSILEYTDALISSGLSDPIPTHLDLYIDCHPVKGSGIHCQLEDLIASRTPALLDQLRQADPKQVPEGSVDLREVKYGAGTAALAASLKKNPPVGVVVASSTGLSGLMVEVLSPLATFVVKGTR